MADHRSVHIYFVGRDTWGLTISAEEANRIVQSTTPFVAVVDTSGARAFVRVDAVSYMTYFDDVPAA